MEQKQKANKKIFSGQVVSDKMNKTIVVSVSRRKLHPIYKKYVASSKKIKAHDENNECQTGDMVRIIESRPLSRDKHFKLLEIVEKAK